MWAQPDVLQHPWQLPVCGHAVSRHRPILFFDEIQNVDGWEHFARRLANQKYQVFITGSNAKMLSRDIQTTLGGRYICGNVFPYSFAEYIAEKEKKTAGHEPCSSTPSAMQKTKVSLPPSAT